MKIVNKKNINELIEKNKLTDFQEEILNDIESQISILLEDKIQKYKNKKRIQLINSKKDKINIKECFNESEIANFPSWVKNNIDKASLIGNSKKIISFENGKKYHLDNKINDLSGNEWIYFLNSVINTRYLSTGKSSYAYHIRKIHPSPKPPQLLETIINFFTKENEIVLDYFMGVGGTLLAASNLNRQAIGIELEQKYIDTYKKANAFLNLKEQITINADSTELLKQKNNINNILQNKLVSLILIDPPYGDMMNKKKSGEKTKNKLNNSPTPFTNLDNDLGNMNWLDFRKVFKESVKDALYFLKNNGHVVIFIKDFQPKDKEINLLHADLIKDINEIENLNYLGLKIWADQGVNLYPYGYPFKFVSNQIHQYILIFRKEK